MTYLEQNIESFPEKYFKVPPGKEFDYDSHSYLMARIETLNELVENLTEGNQVDADEGLINMLSQVIGSMLYQAKQIMEAGEK